MRGRTRASCCVSSCGSSRGHGGDTGGLGVRGEKLFPDGGRRGDTWLGDVRCGVGCMRGGCSRGCVGRTGGGGVGGRHWS